MWMSEGKVDVVADDRPEVSIQTGACQAEKDSWDTVLDKCLSILRRAEEELAWEIHNNENEA